MFESGDLLQSQGQTEGPGHAADVAEAKSRFAEIIAAAERGEEVVIVRRGHPPSVWSRFSHLGQPGSGC
ncbi:type II toxin-antitoxin system Phd/YefM family antitoxin [Gemmobacter lanyuensis]|uniref:type II toxin-antitoxin system Phd/YefM family antitoxin n=1 Tax=Gemmobacter lanyuensis TaxID=1054497 RepID=UPI003571682C